MIVACIISRVDVFIKFGFTLKCNSQLVAEYTVEIHDTTAGRFGHVSGSIGGDRLTFRSVHTVL